MNIDSPDPAIRRQAIITLGKSGETANIPALREISGSDPDMALRELALRAIMSIEKMQWGRVEKEAPPEGIPLSAQEKTAIANKREAQSRLQLAESFAKTGDPTRAIEELHAALKLDGEIAQQPGVLDLAVQLTGQERDEALAAVIYRVENMGKAEETSARAGIPPILQQLFVMGIASLLLVATLNVLVIIVNGRLNGFGGRALIDLVTEARFRRFLPTGGLFLVTVYIATFTMYFAGRSMTGQGTLTRFMSIMLMVQWVTWLAITLVLLFIPVFIFAPLGDGTVAVRINFPVAIIAVMGNFLWQSYFAALGHKADLGRGVAMVFLGVIGGLVAGAVLGVWRQLGF